MVTIFVEGREHEVAEGQNLLQAVLGLGYDLPYFCWHPVLCSVGACRQCAVKQFRDEEDGDGMIVMACMTPVAEAMRISIDDTEAREFRAAVIGWLMTNHPHDCPVCDEGGECHLQDMTVMTGHITRDHRFKKRTYRNQDLGPFLNHEMNRCIHCYRCVRFYREYAGGKDFNVFGSRDRTYFGRFEDGTLESPFSGNLAEICPTGVFTDKTTKGHYTRKWDLQTAPSLCMLCGLGCNTLPGERYGTLRRIRNRYHGEVNRYFLCDRGRFGYEFVNSPRRLRQPIIRDHGGEPVTPVSPAEAMEHVASLLASSDRTIGIGSPRASLEANHVLRTLVGPENFFLGVDEVEARLLSILVKILNNGPARTPSLRDVERADAVLILGEDVTNTAPLLDLALRQSILNAPKQRAEDLKIPQWNDAVVRLVIGDDRGPLFVATPAETALDEIAEGVCRIAPQDIARLGYAIAAHIDSGAPGVTDLEENLASLAETIASTLRGATSPLIIAGVGLRNESILRAAANIASALSRKNPSTALSFVVPESNSLGVGLLEAGNLTEAMAAVAKDEADTVIVLENDLFRRGCKDLVTAFLDKADHVVALDHLENELTDRAEIVLPAATFAECSGTVVNNEGRAQRYLQVFVPQGDVQPSWQWLRRIGELTGAIESTAWTSFGEVARALAKVIPTLDSITDLERPDTSSSPRKHVPRQSHRFSGRTAIQAHLGVSEPKPPDDSESSLAFSMEGAPGPPPSQLITRYWSPGWNSVQSLNRFQEEIAGPLRGGDPGVRLIEPTSSGGDEYFGEPPESFTPRTGEWLLVPLYHLFGSEPLSLETPGIAEQAPNPYIALGPDDCRELGVGQGDMLEVGSDGQVLHLPLKLMTGLARGCAGVPIGLPGLGMLAHRHWAKLSRRP
jgi:NADH-quinone oxidoreductase subunit G